MDKEMRILDHDRVLGRMHFVSLVLAREKCFEKDTSFLLRHRIGRLALGLQYSAAHANSPLEIDVTV